MDKTLFDLYTDFLLSSFGPVTATNLSRLVDSAISHDQITRLLSGEPKRSVHLWQKVKPLVRAVESHEGVIVIDDSISEKPYTDENELICWHWDHSKKRSVKGIQFLTAFYQVGTVGLPVAFDLVTKTETYLDPKTGKEKRRSTISKNERFRMLLRISVLCLRQARKPENQDRHEPFCIEVKDLFGSDQDFLSGTCQTRTDFSRCVT